MELLTSVLVAGGVCACIGAVKAVCRRLTKR
ncbi:unknown [Firmicutes bacterium CAG:124]|nr:unknown [Firmicutes bacterium CAG:124]